jgi:adenylate cyclase
VHKVLAGIAIGLAAALIAVALGFTPFVRTVELKSYDWRVRITSAPEQARKDILVVTIDEDSVRRLEPLVGRWPWPRMIHASLIDYLTRGPAKLIAYDVLFTERDRRGSFAVGDASMTGAESDDALVEATRRAGNVIHAADAAANELVDPSKAVGTRDLATPFALGAVFEERPSILMPFADLAAASRAVGHTLLTLDADGPVRRTAPFVRSNGRHLPSLAFATAMLAAGMPPEAVRVDGLTLVLADRRTPLIEQTIPSFYGDARKAHRALVAFRGPAAMQSGRTTFRKFSFYDLFYSEQQILAGERPQVDPSTFRDAIVIVGTTAEGLKDVFTVPFGEGDMPGAEIHANVIDDVLSGRFIRRAGAGVTIVTAATGAAIVGAAGVLMAPWIATGASVAALGLVWALAVALFRRGVWLDAIVPVLAMALAIFGGVAYQYFVEGREKRKVKKLFSRFVARDVYNQLLDDPARAKLGGQRRTMTVLFSDIRGFTTVSERGQPEDIVAQLNEYFSRMVAVLIEHRGTLDKFVGDMVMALYGAPLDDPEHADHAVASAVAMVRELEALNAKWASEGRPTLDIGIGINSGPMVAGMIGSEAIMSYTVIGDAVNLGSRLESLNKEYHSRIIISESTRELLKGRYDVHPLGSVVVKGKTQPVAIFEVKPPAGVSAPTRAGLQSAAGTAETTS